MKKKEVWFAIPSASPERCRKTLPIWRKMGYKIAILQNVERADVPADIVKWFDYYPGWSESINILCKEIVPASADIVVSGGCDMLPDPNHTAQELAEQFFEKFPDGFGVMQPHGDEFANARHYCGSPFLGRKWIDTMYGGKGPMFGGYKHNWGDVELYWVARGMNALWCRMDLTHFHAHFRREGEETAPGWWMRNVQRHDRHDVELFLSRSWCRFPGHAPVGVDRAYDPQPYAQDTERFAEKHHQSCYAPHGGSDAFSRALQKCANEGLRVIALYGAGAHTRRLGDDLADAPVEVRCVIDDSPARRGTKLWGFPIVSAEEAVAMGVKAIVLSSDAHEGKLFDKCAPLAARGVRVIRVYGPSVDEKNERVAKALTELAAAGAKRVGLYGGEAHTRDLSACLVNPPAEVVCVIDDNPKLAGAKIGPLPVYTLAQARELGLDAVVLSSDRFEAAMWEQTAVLRQDGVRVMPLYDTYVHVAVPGQPACASLAA